MYMSYNRREINTNCLSTILTYKLTVVSNYIPKKDSQEARLIHGTKHKEKEL